MRLVYILMFLLNVSCGGDNSKDRLFKTLYHRTIVPKDGVTIEFIDSNFYLLKWEQNPEKLTWSIESRLTGTLWDEMTERNNNTVFMPAWACASSICQQGF